MSSHEFDRLAAYAERQLEREAAAAVATHLDRCAECRHALADIQKGIALANELETAAMPEAVAGTIRARLVRASPPRWWIAAAAALVALLGGGVYWQVNRPWAQMRAATAEPTRFEAEGRAFHERLGRGERLDFSPRDDQHAWQWLASQRAPVAGLLPNHSADERRRFQVIGAAVRTVAGARASVVSYRIDNRPVTLVLANAKDVAGAPAAGLLSKSVRHRRDANGANVLTWTVGGGTYVMVSELDDFGQRACFVCHTDARFQRTIMSLEPR